MILEKRTTEIQALIFNGLFKPCVLKENIFIAYGSGFFTVFNSFSVLKISVNLFPDAIIIALR